MTDNMDSIRKVNSVIGFGLMEFNKNCDDDDIRIINELFALKLKDVPKFYSELIEKFLEEAPDPEELKEITVSELLDIIMNDFPEENEENE